MQPPKQAPQQLPYKTQQQQSYQCINHSNKATYTESLMSHTKAATKTATPAATTTAAM